MLGNEGHPECSSGEHKKLMLLVRQGKLFELMDWVKEGKPTLIPYKQNVSRSPIIRAARIGNHSMVTFLWKHALQSQWEIDDLIHYTMWENSPAAAEIVLYLLEHGLPIGRLTACDVFPTHNEKLIRLALKRGMDVRGGDGFADALLSTGCSKFLLRLYRELKDDYPDLVFEAHIALRYAAKEGKLRAAALLTWVGVDPEFEFPQDSYNPGLTSSASALGQVRLNEQTREMLKAMKVEMTQDVWFQFFDKSVWLVPEMSDEIFYWRNDGEKILAKDPEKASKVFMSALNCCADWVCSYPDKEYQKKGLIIAEYLASRGVPCLLRLNERNDYNYLRRTCYGAQDTKPLVRVFWVLFQYGDYDQRDRLRELCRVGKMQSIVRDHDPQLVRDLGLGTKRQLEYQTDPEDRPWRMETYEPPVPWGD
jgi:hypothetical protein